MKAQKRNNKEEVEGWKWRMRVGYEMDRDKEEFHKKSFWKIRISQDATLFEFATR